MLAPRWTSTFDRCPLPRLLVWYIHNSLPHLKPVSYTSSPQMSKARDVFKKWIWNNAEIWRLTEPSGSKIWPWVPWDLEPRITAAEGQQQFRSQHCLMRRMELLSGFEFHSHKTQLIYLMHGSANKIWWMGLLHDTRFLSNVRVECSSQKICL
jgi:hypothetical protein